MKLTALTFSLLLAIPVYAQLSRVEFDQPQEKTCYTEVQKLGCLNSSGEEDLKCVEKNKAKLTTPCQAMHEEKKANQ